MDITNLKASLQTVVFYWHICILVLLFITYKFILHTNFIKKLPVVLRHLLNEAFYLCSNFNKSLYYNGLIDYLLVLISLLCNITREYLTKTHGSVFQR